MVNWLLDKQERGRLCFYMQRHYVTQITDWDITKNNLMFSQKGQIHQLENTNDRVCIWGVFLAQNYKIIERHHFNITQIIFI